MVLLSHHVTLLPIAGPPQSAQDSLLVLCSGNNSLAVLEGPVGTKGLPMCKASALPAPHPLSGVS